MHKHTPKILTKGWESHKEPHVEVKTGELRQEGEGEVLRVGDVVRDRGGSEGVDGGGGPDDAGVGVGGGGGEDDDEEEEWQVSFRWLCGETNFKDIYTPTFLSLFVLRFFFLKKF